MRKPSFFERITGSIAPNNYDDLFESADTPIEVPHASAVVSDHTMRAPQPHTPVDTVDTFQSHSDDSTQGELEEEPIQEGELSVDIYQTNDAIVVKALIAGVNPTSIDISLTRDMVTIRGHREEHKEVAEENYFYKELYWGAFTRTILLPEEVDVDAAEATTTHGILIIRLPKINKERKTKLKVKTGTTIR